MFFLQLLLLQPLLESKHLVGHYFHLQTDLVGFELILNIYPELQFQESIVIQHTRYHECKEESWNQGYKETQMASHISNSFRKHLQLWSYCPGTTCPLEQQLSSCKSLGTYVNKNWLAFFFHVRMDWFTLDLSFVLQIPKMGTEWAFFIIQLCINYCIYKIQEEASHSWT